ncbi:glutamine synthetase [Schizosaccharomyces japonicus yFS275]|uniref:Glutamine synthetase n=1 Tax=Schizosaccharomyces japonicus (strain yFS275 / FY16936) TaxID=402676 RepID=B6JZ23_SCHJY|nr:glutamine synthetase [Schizosaccharomyces japonicus yFS275]EEB06791.1 glutamine synthetase [Schizosaccharomyces japonicus yFS275]
MLVYTNPDPVSVYVSFDVEGRVHEEYATNAAHLDLPAYSREEVYDNAYFSYNAYSMIRELQLQNGLLLKNAIVIYRGNKKPRFYAELSNRKFCFFEKGLDIYKLYLYDFETGLPSVQDPRFLLRIVNEKYQRFENEVKVAFSYNFYYFRNAKDVSPQQGISKLQASTYGMAGYELARVSDFKDQWTTVTKKCVNMFAYSCIQHEIAGLEYTLIPLESMEMADEAMKAKFIITNYGRRAGLYANFMAKPLSGLPGCSGFVRVNLSQNPKSVPVPALAKKHHNLYEESAMLQAPAEQFLAGVLLAARDLVLIFAPTVNSYKRLWEQSSHLTSISWGLTSENAIRIVAPPLCELRDTHLEIRIPGADAQPHLVLAAILAAGYYGIETNAEIPFPPIGPFSAPQKLDAAVERLTQMPKSLGEAIEVFRAPNSMARKLLGDGFVNYYSENRLAELNEWNKTVGSWEQLRYMEVQYY